MSQKIAYLTIDDGPTKDIKQKIDFLNSKGIKTIWFCLGSELKKFENEVVYAIKKGHIIGSHSFDHSNFSEISLAEVRKQIWKTDKIIDNIYKKAGIPRPIKLFRFPYLNNGSKDEYQKCNWKNKHVKAIQKILQELGYRQPKFKNINYKWFKKAGFDKCVNVDCTYDSFDWCLEEGQEIFGYHDLPTVLARMDEDVPEGGRGLNNPYSNEIIMMHDWIPLDAFKALIENMLNKNIIFGLPEIISVEIRPIKQKDYKKVHKFQSEYLDKESFKDFVKRVKANPDLYLVAFDGNFLVGICYGHPSDRVGGAVDLQGIAVSLDETKGYARKGIGSKLIEKFAEVAKKKGFRKIGVGSSDDSKVESFYLKNGFRPFELVAKGEDHKEFERVKIKDYKSGKIKQKALRKKHKSKEVIFIFQKPI